MTKVNRSVLIHRCGSVQDDDAYISASARHVDLEPSVAGADRARSYSCWVRVSNVNPNVNDRIFNIAGDANTTQLNCFVIAASNNTGVQEKLRFILHTDASNYIFIQSQNAVALNRWLHLVFTYSGSEVETGLNMAINSVIESSPTRTPNGTYTGALNNANLRFKVGHELHSIVPTVGFRGNIRDLCVWNKVLTQTEINELYNQGVPVNIANLSFYSDIVAFYPLQQNAQCFNNATFNMTTTGSVSFFARDILPSGKMLSLKRVQSPNSRYVAFGNMIRISSTLVSWYGRSGTDHVLGGKIVRIDFNPVTGVASAPVDVITDATYDLRGGSVGIDDNGDIHVFASRYNGGTDTFIDTGKYTSTDGGVTFGAIQTFAVTETRFNFYGKHIAGFAAGEFFVPFFEHDGTNYLVSVFKTTDNWATHSKITVYSGTALELTEPAILNVGNNTLIILARRNATPFGIYQMDSTDGGDTWSAPTLTNLASTTGGSNCEMILTQTGKISVLIGDRGLLFIMKSRENNIATVLADPTAWRTTEEVASAYTTDTTYGILGYANIVNLLDGNVLSTYSTEQSSSRADLFFGVGTL